MIALQPRFQALVALVLLSSVALLSSCGSDDSGVTAEPGPAVDAAPEADAPLPEAADDGDAGQQDAEEAPDVADAADAAVDSGDAGPFTVEQELTLASVTSGHLAFPDVTRLSDGRFLLVYRQGASHVDKTGRIMKQFGTADGTTWTDPAVLYDVADMDDRDPSVATLANGDLLVTYFQYQRLTLPDGTLAVHHCFAGRSQDNGESFGSFVQIDPGEMAPAGAVLDADGHWVDGNGQAIIVQGCSSAAVAWQGKVVLPTYGGQSLNLADMAGSLKSRIYLYESADDGDTWTGGVIAADKATDHWLEEPALLELDDGTVLMHLRTAKGASPGNAGKMMQVMWDGTAADWSDVTAFPFVGHAPELVQLEDGVVLSGFRELNDVYTKEWVSFVYSTDRGASWSAPVRVADCGTSECGYPAIEDLGSRRFLFVYYAPGGKAIKATIYRYDQL